MNGQTSSNSNEPRFEFRWRNFRSFPDTGWIEIRPITVVIGANNSGKTSLIRPLLLMKQTVESRDARIALKTTGPLTDVGRFSDLVFGHKSRTPLTLELRFGRPNDTAPPKKLEPIGAYPPGEIRAEFTAGRKPTDINLRRLVIRDIFGRLFVSRTRLGDGRYSVEFDQKLKPAFMKAAKESLPTHFLFPGFAIMNQLLREQADRLRKARKRKQSRRRKVLALNVAPGAEHYISAMEYANDMVSAILSRLSYVGPLREYPQRFYESKEEVPPTVGLRGEDAPHILFLKKDRSFRDSVGHWLRTLELAKKISCATRYEDLFAVRTWDPKTGSEIDFADTGFGLSQVLPLVVEVFHAPKEGIVFLEQPEIHLNPRLQCTLANLFAQVSENKKTVIIETHSEHFVLRLRSLIAERKLKPDHVALYYVEKDAGRSSVRRIPILEDGHIESEDWPKGFFEESLGEALRLARAPSK